MSAFTGHNSTAIRSQNTTILSYFFVHINLCDGSEIFYNTRSREFCVGNKSKERPKELRSSAEKSDLEDQKCWMFYLKVAKHSCCFNA